MEDNNQNFQVEPNNYNNLTNNNSDVPKKKFSKWPNVLCSVLCVVLVGISLLYLFETLSFEGLEGFAILVTLPLIFVSNLFATIISIVNFIVAIRKSKAQKIYALILMIAVIVYSIISICIIYFGNKN